MLAVAAIVVAVAAVVWISGRSDGYQRHLTPEAAGTLASREALDPRSRFLIGCEAIDFREDSKTWLVECHQGKRTRWLVNDETGEVEPE